MRSGWRGWRPRGGVQGASAARCTSRPPSSAGVTLDAHARRWTRSASCRTWRSTSPAAALQLARIDAPEPGLAAPPRRICRRWRATRWLWRARCRRRRRGAGRGAGRADHRAARLCRGHRDLRRPGQRQPDPGHRSAGAACRSRSGSCGCTARARSAGRRTGWTSPATSCSRWRASPRAASSSAAAAADRAGRVRRRRPARGARPAQPAEAGRRAGGRAAPRRAAPDARPRRAAAPAEQHPRPPPGGGDLAGALACTQDMLRIAPDRAGCGGEAARMNQRLDQVSGGAAVL